MSRTLCGAVGVAATLWALSPAHAEGVRIDLPIVAVSSWDELGEATNVVLTVDVADAAGFGSGTPVILNGLGFDLTLETFNFSWLSEAEILLEDAAAPGGGIVLNPGFGDDFSGMDTYVRPLEKLAPAETLTLSNGLLRIEFYENFDDLPDVIDAEWNGTLSVQVIPAPAAPAALLGSLALARRRR